MSPPSRRALLATLDPLDHDRRLAHLARVAREERDQPALRALIRELLSGDVSDAHLALRLAMAASDEAALFEALEHPSVSVQAVAARWVATHAQSIEALRGAVLRASPATRRRLLKGLALARRSALAETLFEPIALAHGLAEAGLLVPALTPATQRRVLPEVAHVLTTWRSLALRQPDLVLEFVAGELRAAPESQRRLLLDRRTTALVALTLRRPGPLLALLTAVCPPDVLPSFLRSVLPRLLRHQPEATLALLLRPAAREDLLQRFLDRGTLRALGKLPGALRKNVARALAHRPHLLAQLLSRVPPRERPELLEHAWAEARPVPAPPVVLATLPGDARDAAAARELEVRQVRESETLRLEVTALRRPANVLQELLGATRAAKAEARSFAWQQVIACAGREQAGLDVLLQPLERLKNEQDPVRQAALGALAALPIGHFQASHLPALEAQVTWATEARDASRATHASLQSLAIRLLRAHAARPEAPQFSFALWTLKRLAGQSGMLQLPDLERDLPRGAEHHLVAALLPLIRAANARESHQLVLSLTTALGRRAWGVDLLQALLEPVTRASPEWLAQSAITLWLEPPRTRDVRVRKLIDGDASTAVLEPVFAHLHRRRQDWLDPLLEDRPPKGRFATGRTLWIPPRLEGCFRWLPRQQARLRERLLRVASDAQRSAFERAGALGSIARLPTTTLEVLAPFTSSDEVAVAEAALAATAWLEAPSVALPVLLQHLDGDRARVATYALARVAKLSPADMTVTTVESLLSRERLKITVHKEAVRLLGAFRSARSLPLLRAELDRPGLHRDVRIAVGHALFRLLADEEAWALLSPLASDPHPDVAASLLDPSPLLLAPTLRPRYAALLLEVTRHPEARVREAAWSRILPWSTGAEERLAREAASRVLDLTGAPEWRRAAEALVQLARHASTEGTLVACAEGLLALTRQEPAETTIDRDLPASQRLTAILAALESWPESARQEGAGLLMRLAQVLATDEAWWPQQVSLRLQALELTRPTPEALRTLLTLAEQLVVDPLRQPVLAEALARRLQTSPADQDAGALLDLADALTEPAPLAALALVAHAGRQLAWSPATTERLRRLRRDESPTVRARARAVLTAPE